MPRLTAIKYVDAGPLLKLVYRFSHKRFGAVPRAADDHRAPPRPAAGFGGARDVGRKIGEDVTAERA